ncbi:ABC transporter permease [Proteiniphilum sp. UBA5384]|uniref:ABC transporter permease n=1 Tax=Proteiniphilum sp. UBA5384 TaxID=1947279 RepID=UPI0025D818AC|nr:ABC transporter permease [Proteiniphilum sp. UBA5384]
MKQFRSFVRKEYYHIFRDKRTMLILLAMPIVQILLFGFAITTEVKDVKVAVFDPSKDASTQRIKERINTSEYFTIAEELTNIDQINDIFKYGKINLVIVFSENFAENLLHTGEAKVQLIADGTDPNQASTLTGYVSGILGSYQQELMEQYQVPFQIIPETRMLYNPQLKSAYNFVPGVMGLILMLICAMMTSIAIVREKETGTMEVLLSSPMKPIYIILAKAVPYFTLSIVNLITILLLSVFVLGVPVSGSLFWLAILSLLFVFVALALGLFISTLVNTQMAAMLASGMGLMMPIMLLSGMMFPIESMPPVLQWVSAIVPARWYIEAVKKIMIQGVELQYIAKELVIIGVMAISLIMLALSKFKTRLS